ncbi:MAG: hypothetical protein LBM41_06965 [Ruminococcus sp.]|jgi:hypothetical protein|nr:hypothetical protein [Ruminococcus sp.]
MKTLRIILLIITGIVTVFFGVIINVLGAIGFILNQVDYSQGSYGLIVAAPLLLAAYIMVIFKMSITPAIFTVIGSAGYLYTIYYLNSLAAGWMPGWVTDKIAQNHLPSIYASIFLLVLCALNYFLPEKMEKRKLRRDKKISDENRALTEDEKIM